MRQRVLSVALVALLVLLCAGMAWAQNTNGSGGDMPAYYDHQLLTINLKELPPDAEAAALAHNTQLNTIYTSEAVLPGGGMFIAVLDAIQGDGFNPLWGEREIMFLKIDPKQFFSDDEILAAFDAGDIDLDPRPPSSPDELYRCSVVGPK
jgi:hypothetical protein